MKDSKPGEKKSRYGLTHQWKRKKFNLRDLSKRIRNYHVDVHEFEIFLD